MTGSGRRKSRRHDLSGFIVADLSNFPLREQETRNRETRDLRHSSVSSIESIRERFIATSMASSRSTTSRAPSHSISTSQSTAPRPGSLIPVNPLTSRPRRALGSENTRQYGTGGTPSQDSELHRRRSERKSSRDRRSGNMHRLNTMAGRPSQSERPDKSPITTVSSSIRSWAQSLVSHSDSNAFSHTTDTSDWPSIRSLSPETPKPASDKLEPSRTPEQSRLATTEQKWIGDSAVWRPGTPQEIPTRVHYGKFKGLDYKSPGNTFVQEWRDKYMNKESTPSSLVENIIKYHDEQTRAFQNKMFSLISRKPPGDPSDVREQKTTELNREISKIKSAIAVAHNDNLNYQTTIRDLQNELDAARAVAVKQKAEVKRQERLVERFTNELKKRQANDRRESEFRAQQALLQGTQGLATKVKVVEAPRVAVTAMKTPASARFGGGVRHVESYHDNNMNTVGMNLCLMEMEDLYSADSYRLATVAVESALKYAENQNNKKFLAETYAWAGVCYHRSSDVKSAMSYFEAALETAEGLKQDEDLLDWSGTISEWLRDLKKFERRWT